MLCLAIERYIINLAIWMLFHKSNEVFGWLKIMGNVLRNHYVQSALQCGYQIFCWSRVFEVVNIWMIGGPH